jgi:hypothetical protein
MKTMLRKLTIRAAAAALAILAVTSGPGAFAQSDARMRINVPFAFAAGDASFEAGTYFVSRRATNVVQIRSVDGKQTALLTTTPLAGDKAGESSAVVFHRYGDSYYFAGMQTLDGKMIYETSRPKAEQRLAREAGAGQTVVVATK